MSLYTPASEVILRHRDQFIHRNLLIAGDIQDNLVTELIAKQVKLFTSYYQHWQRLQSIIGRNALFGLLVNKEFTADCDTLLYFWPKSKQEALFQLENILSCLPIGCEIFIVGENRSGVRSVENLLTDSLTLNKIDSARRCSLFHGQLQKTVSFSLEKWWHSFSSHSLTIKTLPGVFSRDGLDIGSALLLDAIPPEAIKGNILDIGCGSGILAAALAKQNPTTQLTLCDINAAALAASQATLAANNLTGHVIASNMFSEITTRFDLIVSNPPFHEGININLSATESLLHNARQHLTLNGQLYIVANAFLPYPKILDATFGNHQVIAQTSKFKVYQTAFKSKKKD